MYQDYLQERQRLQRRRVQSVTQKRQSNPQRQRTQYGSAQQMIRARKQLSDVQKTAIIISRSVQLLFMIAKTKIGLITIAGAGLVSLIGYLKDKKEMEYNPQIGGSYAEKGLYEENSQTAVIKNKIIKEAKAQKVDPNLALAVAEQESKFNPKATSPVGAKGLFQLMPETAESVGVTDPYNIDQNIKGGIKYLKWCLNNTDTVEEALVAYNAGIGNLRKAKKAGKKIDSITDRGSYAAEVMQRQQKFKEETKNLKPEVVKTTSAGKIKRVSNGTMIGDYKMSNPVAHDGKYYIDLSERAEAYLRDVGGKGLITSGAEGSHGKGVVSHGSGNKIDVVAYRNTDEEWANTAIPFIKNKNTAYINFEDFSEERFKRIKAIIYSKISQDLKQKCESSVKYSFGRGKKFLFCYYTGGGLHLDIGILPDSYSDYQEKREQKEQKTIPTQKQQKKEQKTQYKPQKQVQNTTIKPQNTQNIQGGIDTNKVNVLAARNFNKSKRKS